MPGVHALGQVAAFDTASTIPADRWKYALNSVLPDDIKVVASQEARPDFHPRFDAVSKMYRYQIYRGETGVALSSLCLLFSEPLNFDHMQEG